MQELINTNENADAESKKVVLKIVSVTFFSLLTACFLFLNFLKYFYYDPMDVGDMCREADRLKEQKKYSQAILQYYKARLFFTEGFTIEHVDRGLIECYILTGNYPFARFYLNEGRKGVEPNSNHLLIAKTYIAEGNLKMARKNLRLLLDDNDIRPELRKGAERYWDLVKAGKFSEKPNSINWSFQ